MKSQRISFTSEVVDDGWVVYEVARVGTFTMGFNPAAYRCQDYESDGENLRVIYGEITADGLENLASTATAWPGAPRVNGITLHGSSCFKRADALAHLEPMDEAGCEDVCGRWSGWLGVWRGSPRVSVPSKTRDRVAHIVAVLATDFVSRDDAGEILAAFRRAMAPQRVEAHRDELALVHREIAEWLARARHVEQLLAGQEAILEGDDCPQALGPRPQWRDYRSALTRDGESFLLQTVGATRAAYEAA